MRKVQKDKLLQFKIDITYMTDLFAKFNGTNLKLQSDELHLIPTKRYIYLPKQIHIVEAVF